MKIKTSVNRTAHKASSQATSQMKTQTTSGVNRRQFICLAGVVGGGLALGFYSPSQAEQRISENTEPRSINAYVQIKPNGEIVIAAKNPEVGQGVKTSLPMIVAEELDVDWSQVTVEQAAIDYQRYGAQFAGGSFSIPSNYALLRTAGATARAMLIAAAAQQWSVAKTECTTQSARVLHKASGRQLSYGELAQSAAKQAVPDESSLEFKSPADYRIVGHRIGGVDNLAIVTGEPLFGIDQQVDDMLYAVYQKCPAFGGRVISANYKAVKQLPGVVDVFALEGNGDITELSDGVAIVATSTWAALSARKQLRVEWDESDAAKDSWSDAVEKAQTLAEAAGEKVLTKLGDPEATLKAADKRVSAYYEYPFLSHAQLEPENCTASVRDGVCELWAPTQMPQRAVSSVAKLLDLDERSVLLHQTRIGGGFGRRLKNDYVCEAAAIAARLKQPVKLQWSREDDMAHDFYRVGGFHHLQAGLDKQGKLSAWKNHFVSFANSQGKPAEGGHMLPNEFPVSLLNHALLEQTNLTSDIPCGWWRAPGACAVAFAVQGFLHELSVAANRDHLAFMLDLLGEPRWLEEGNVSALHTGRAAGVIQLAADKAGWGKPMPQGRGLGLAFHFSHAGHIAEVAEVSVSADKKLILHKVTVAADVGRIINPSGAENQIQGSVIDGYSSMVGLAIDFTHGRVQQSNYHDYPLLRIAQAPSIDIHFIESDFSPTGLGEPALPPLAPAVANAIHAASGIRVRKMPLKKEGFTV